MCSVKHRYFRKERGGCVEITSSEYTLLTEYRGFTVCESTSTFTIITGRG